MSSMELQLKTDAAVKALETFDAKLLATQGKLRAFDTSGIDKLATAVRAIPTVDKGVATSITAIGRAIEQIGKTTNIDAVAKSLNGLSGLANLSNAASNVQAFTNALKGMRVPRNLATLAKNIADVGLAAQAAAPAVQRLSGALGNVQAPTGLAAAVTQINKIGQASGTSTKSVMNFGSALQVAAGLGIAASIQQAAQSMLNFASASITAASEMDQFNGKMSIAADNGQEVAGSFEFIDRVTNKLGTSLQGGLNAFGQLSVSMSEVGISAEDSRTVFEGFSTGFRAMGLSTVQVARGFTAINQMFTKGTVSMEELRQQLGEVFPAFGALAKSMGLGTLELAQLIGEGKVASPVMIKLAQDIKERLGPAAEAMAGTPMAALDRFYNALFKVQTLFGQNMAAGFVAGLQALEAAMSSPTFETFLGLVGQGLGLALQVAGQAVQAVVSGVQLFANIVSVAVSPITGFIDALIGAGSAGSFFSGTLSLVGAALQRLAPILVTTALLYGTYVAGLKAVALATTLASTALGGFLIRAAALAIGVAGAAAVVTILGSAFAALYQSATSDVGFFDAFNENIKQVETLAGQAAGGIAKMAAEAVALIPDINGIAAGADSAATGLDQTADAAGAAATGVQGVAASAAPAAQSAEQLATNMGNAATNATDLAGNTQAVGSAAAGASGAMGGAAGAANSLAAAYRNAAAAARELASAQASVGGGGGGTVSSQSGGGYAGSMTRTQSVKSMSVFKGAPHLAGGIDNTNKLTPSLPGGGIPSVLHSNEAVVPLAGGGSIPVSMSAPMGGDGGATASILRSLASTMGRLLERFDAGSTQANGYLKTIADILTNASRGASGGGGGGGGSVSGASGGGGLSIGGGGGSFRGGSVGPSGGLLTSSISGGGGGATGDGQIGGLDYGMITQYQGLVNAVTQARQAMGAAAASANTFRYGTGNGALYVAPSDAAAIASAGQRLNEARQALTLFERAHPDFMAAYQKLLGGSARGYDAGSDGFGALTSRGTISGFATGSPNASKDMMRGGGFNAVLHPNEAVIPLPDGRSVPVQLPRQLKQQMANGGMRPERTPRQEIINFNITTPDAESFRRSETQITERMRANLARANERAGPPSRKFEDPTRREVQVK